MKKISNKMAAELLRHLPIVIGQLPKDPSIKVRNSVRVLKNDLKRLKMIKNSKKGTKTSINSGKSEKPNLNNYRTIKTYEDACNALHISPVGHKDFPEHIEALVKLETISSALWGKDFCPDIEKGNILYFPWFIRYSKEEVKRMDKETRGALFGGSAHHGAVAGFGYLTANNRSSYANAYFGFRLYQETREKAAYLGKQFIDLWTKYLFS